MSFYTSRLDQIGPHPLTDKCIVLDLDECLIHTYNEQVLTGLGVYTNPKLQKLRKRAYNILVKDAFVAKGTGREDYVQGIKRPHLELFLTFCFSYFKVVAVWSAGKKTYVEAIVKEIFKNVRQPHVVYTWDNLRFDYGGQKYDKPLLKMIKEVPNLANYMNLNNTFMLDDRDSSFIDNYANGIQIPAYDPQPTIDELSADDIALLQLKRWLTQDSIAYAPDVKELDKSVIFNTPLPNYPAVNSFKPRRLLAEPAKITMQELAIM